MGKRARGQRIDVGQQARSIERAKTPEAVSGHEHLERLVEQSRRRRLQQQLAEFVERCARFGRDGEFEFGSQTHGTQHAHRIFAVAQHRITDQAQFAPQQIFIAADVVTHREIGDVVVERVDREVAAHRILFDRAVDVVSHDAAIDDMAVAAAVVARSAKRGDFDDLIAEHDMGEAETPPDQAAIAEQALDVFGRCVRGDVEILRPSAEQQIAYGAADEESGEAGFVEPVEHTQCTRGNVLARDRVLFARDNAQGHLHGDIGSGLGGIGHSLSFFILRTAAGGRTSMLRPIKTIY